MPQSLSGTHLHLIFSTRDRAPLLTEAALRAKMHAYLGGISKNLGCPPVIVGGVADHVHLLAQFGRTVTVADWVKELKRSSSLWAKGQGLPAFGWQAGYGVFSVGSGQIPIVKAYFANQEEHHRTRSFQEEYLEILREFGIEWDERYIWE